MAVDAFQAGPGTGALGCVLLGGAYVLAINAATPSQAQRCVGAVELAYRWRSR